MWLFTSTSSRPELCTRTLHDALPIFTLHVGAGTFQPVRTERIADHRMHAERFFVPAATITAVQRTRELGGRSEEHTSELQSRGHLVCRLLLGKKNQKDKR